MLCRLSLSLRVPQRQQGYQTTSKSVLAHRPDVIRAAWTQRSRAANDEKAPLAFSRSRLSQGQELHLEQTGAASRGSSMVIDTLDIDSMLRSTKHSDTTAYSLAISVMLQTLSGPRMTRLYPTDTRPASAPIL